MRSLLTTTSLALALALLAPAPAAADQPMDRLERLIEVGKPADAVEIARKWLSKNEGDARVAAVRKLLDEALWQHLAVEPDRAALAAYRAEFPESEHESAARELEASLAYYAAIKDGSEDAFRAVVDGYAGTPAATDALSKAAEAGYAAAELTSTSEAWSVWLSRYPHSEKREAAASAMATVAWAEAEAENTVQAWLQLRAANPDHPRVEEARERESTLAAAEASTTEEMLAVAARYQGTPAARSTLRRALFGSQMVAVLAGEHALVRDGEGRVRRGFGEVRERVSKLMQGKERMPGDTVAAWIELDAPIPRKVELAWMKTGIEPAPVATASLAPAPQEGASLGPGALRVPSQRALGMRGEGFGDMELSVLFEAGPQAPSLEALAAAPRPALCPEVTVEATVGALLRRWESCGDGLISGELDGYWATTEAALTEAEAVVGPEEPGWGPGCAAPGPAPVLDGDGAPTESAAPAPEDEEAPSDDDDSAEEPAPPVPAWLGLAAPARSEARDLDGDGVAEGLHVIGDSLVLVDGRGLSVRVFAGVGDVEAALGEVGHDGCSYTVGAPASPATEGEPKPQ